MTIPFYARAGALFVLAASVATPLAAQDDFFGSLDVDIDASATAANDSDFSVLGWFSEKVAYGFERPDAMFARDDKAYSRIESSLFLQTDWQVNAGASLRFSASAYRDKVYDYEDDFAYGSEEVSELRSRFEVRDFYLETSLGETWFKLGNQIVAWGLSENLSIADLVNTRNHYSFGQQDIEDLRLQVPALQLSRSLSDWTLDAVLTYKAGSHDVARAGDEFDQYIRFRHPGLHLTELAPEQESEYFLRASSHYSNGDISIVFADVNQNDYGVLDVRASGEGKTTLMLQQDRMQAVAATTTWVEGSWLIFAEAGVHLGKALAVADPFMLAAGSTDKAQFEKDQWLAAAGLEYSGFRDLTLTLEADLVHTRDHDPVLLAEAQEVGFSGRLLWNALNDRLQVLAVYSQLPGNQGNVLRASLDYDWSDQLELGLLLVTYDAEAGTRFFDYRHNDIFQLQLTYSFQR